MTGGPGLDSPAPRSSSDTWTRRPVQRSSTGCAHCGRDSSDRDRELLEAALRARIRVLEAKVLELEAEIATVS